MQLTGTNTALVMGISFTKQILNAVILFLCHG